MDFIEWVKLLLEILKFPLAAFGVYLVTRQLYYNRTGAKDKLIYDINKGMQEFNAATAYIERLRDAMRGENTAAGIPNHPNNADAPDMTKQIDDFFGDFTKHEEKIRDNLRMLETVMMMLETGVVRDDDVFPLIGYRIITVINSPIVQREFLYRRIGEDGIRPAFRFASVFALYDRVMIYNVNRFYSSPSRGEDFLEEFKFIPAYDLAKVKKWKHERSDFIAPKSCAFDREFWDLRCRHSMDDISESWHRQDNGSLFPYETALVVYQRHRPKRPSLLSFFSWR